MLLLQRSNSAALFLRASKRLTIFVRHQKSFNIN
jgi:hypothetical protein